MGFLSNSIVLRFFFVERSTTKIVNFQWKAQSKKNHVSAVVIQRPPYSKSIHASSVVLHAISVIRVTTIPIVVPFARRFCVAVVVEITVLTQDVVNLSVGSV